MFDKRAWSSIHKATATCFAPGEQVANPIPGDFILTHGKSWSSRLIRFGESIRYWGPDKKFTRWNHAAIFVNGNGDIVEALGGGVQKRNIAVYKDTEYHVVHLEDVIDLNREHECLFASACLHDHYGWLTILSIALSLLSGSKPGFGVDGQEICSALVARCVERTGEIFPNRSVAHHACRPGEVLQRPGKRIGCCNRHDTGRGNRGNRPLELNRFGLRRITELERDVGVLAAGAGLRPALNNFFGRGGARKNSRYILPSSAEGP
jgi:hypothetical protein